MIVLYQTKNNPFEVKQKSSVEAKNPHQSEDPAIALFTNNCARCHGSFGQGQGGNPSLRKIQLSPQQIEKIIRSGRGRMPSFDQFSDEQLHMLSQLVRRL